MRSRLMAPFHNLSRNEEVVAITHINSLVDSDFARIWSAFQSHHSVACRHLNKRGDLGTCHSLAHAVTGFELSPIDENVKGRVPVLTRRRMLHIRGFDHFHLLAIWPNDSLYLAVLYT